MESESEPKIRLKGVVDGQQQQVLGIHVEKSVEFSYDFSISNKTEEGGFGAVKYAELRGKQGEHKSY
ncbi:hypothetical protein KY284_016908 [Solanum tuberosum]|nr:hypothetical protein KY284_016908 [Solanum tuberosum]